MPVYYYFGHGTEVSRVVCDDRCYMHNGNSKSLPLTSAQAELRTLLVSSIAATALH